MDEGVLGGLCRRGVGVVAVAWLWVRRGEWFVMVGRGELLGLVAPVRHGHERRRVSRSAVRLLGDGCKEPGTSQSGRCAASVGVEGVVEALRGWWDGQKR